MQQEIYALQIAQGEGVPKLIDSNVDRYSDRSTPLFFVMEWIEGPTLEKLCSKGPLPLNSALAVTLGILSVVERCHQAGIRHRDIKHLNVILREGKPGSPVLLDFGLAWIPPDSDDERRDEDSIGQRMGNEFFRLPEDAPDRLTRDERSDLARIVGLLFYMLTGKAPRQPRDEDGQKPHERHYWQFPEEVRSDQRWPRLARVFNVGFEERIDRRFQSTKNLREYLANLSPPELPDISAQLEEEMARLADAENSVSIQEKKSNAQIRRDALQRFHQKLIQCLSSVDCDWRTQRVLSINPNEVTIFHKITGASFRKVHYAHEIIFKNGEILGKILVNSSEWEQYYSGPVSNPASFFEHVDGEVPAVAVRLLKAMNENRIDHLA